MNIYISRFTTDSFSNFPYFLASDLTKTANTLGVKKYDEESYTFSVPSNYSMSLDG